MKANSITATPRSRTHVSLGSMAEEEITTQVRHSRKKLHGLGQDGHKYNHLIEECVREHKKICKRAQKNG